MSSMSPTARRRCAALQERGHGGDTSVDAFRGLARRRPTVAVGLTVFLLAQAGVPFTSGFIAKFGVIQAAVEENSYAIAIIAMVAAVIAALATVAIVVSLSRQEAVRQGLGR